jgi:hypothetical protein
VAKNSKYTGYRTGITKINSWLPLLTWFLPLHSPLEAIIILMIFGPCMLNLHAKLVTSMLEKIKLQKMMEAKP